MSGEISHLQRRVAAAQGRVPCDLVLKNVRYLDVFSLSWRPGDLGVVDGVVVGVEPGLKGTRTIDGKGKSLVPGFIDAHVHIESSLLTPTNFEKLVLAKGTTTVFCDPHELTNVQGISGLQYFLTAAETAKLDMRVMLSSCVPATHLETNGGGEVTSADLLKVSSHRCAHGLAEMMNVPGVLAGDPSVLSKITAFAHRPIDGHAPMLRGKELSAYLSTGIATCHESTEYAEAEEKLSKGMAVWIREGSVAKDLHALLPLLDVARSTSVGFCTDDRNPKDIADEGHLDFLVRTAIAKGVAPEVVYRCASWSVANRYGLRHKGAIAPGFEADWVMLDDRQTCAISQVFRRGHPVTELEFMSAGRGEWVNSVRAKVPELTDLQGAEGRVHVMGVEAGKILTQHRIMSSNDPGVARITVLERYGKGSKPANAYVYGFGRDLKGAIASSVGHDSHNLIVVGSSTKDMQVALRSLVESGGGFSVVRDGAVTAHLALPFGGLMSYASADEVCRGLRELHAASRAIGCEVPEPFLQLAFLSLPVIPSLKLTDRGLVDVEKFKLIDVAA